MRRQQIQDASKEVFLNKGFRYATIEDIARKAELSPATIYQYFKSKDELYASLNLETLEVWFNETKKISQNKTLSPEEKISRFKDAMHKAFLKDPRLLRHILLFHLQGSLSSLSDNLIERLNRLGREIMNMMADAYDDGVRQGIFAEGRGITHADIMWAIFSGVVLYEYSKKDINPKKDFLKTTLDRAFEIFLEGIKKR